MAREPRSDLLAIDDALHQLAAFDERKSQVVELRFFGGLSVKETAEVLKVSPENRNARLEAVEGLAAQRTEHLENPMQGDRWRKIDEIFHSALKVDESRRTAFLDETCSGDHDLRLELERLLARYAEAGTFLESPALEMAAQAWQSTTRLTVNPTTFSFPP